MVEYCATFACISRLRSLEEVDQITEVINDVSGRASDALTALCEGHAIPGGLEHWQIVAAVSYDDDRFERNVELNAERAKISVLHLAFVATRFDID